VCTTEIPEWERDAGDQSFDFQRAERLVEAEENGTTPAIRSHHLRINVLEYVSAHDDLGKLHIDWKLEIQIGNEEPYTIQRHFNLFKTLLANLKAWEFNPKEVMNRVGKFTAALPTANWARSYTDDKNLKLRLEKLQPWCKELGRWASQIMDPKTGDAFVDYLSIGGSEAEKQVMAQKLQMQEGLEPIRQFFLPDDSHSASYRAEMMRATQHWWF
jgi:hypothetical protein